MSKKIVLIDGNSLAYRAFFALPLLSNESGIHTNAVYGFTMMIQKVLEEEKPTHMLVAFDAGKTTFRHASFKEYKGGRQKTPPELSEQFPYLRKLLDAFQIKQYELDHYEADDIIGTLSKEAEAQDFEVVVISGDKDLTQLASAKTSVQITKKGITDLEIYTPEHVQEKYELTPHQIIDMKGLMGDSSDNIPGVPGVGEKTAIKLLKQFETVEGVYAHMDEVKGVKLKENLQANEELAYLSKKLATIERQAPLTLELNDLEYTKSNDEAVTAIFRELNFKSLLDKQQVAEVSEDIQTIEWTKVDDVSSINLQSPAAIHVELSNDHVYAASIIGMGICQQSGNFYIPFDVVKASYSFKEWAEDESIHKYVTDSKAARTTLGREGIQLNGVVFDFVLASYVVNPAITSIDIAILAKEWSYSEVFEDEQVYGKGAKRTEPEEEKLADHVVRKALTVWNLHDQIESKLKENEQLRLLNDLELPLAQVLGDMEAIGVKVNRQELVTMGEDLAMKLEKIEKSIFEAAGESFNINSPKQLGVILFEKIGLPVIKKTKTGYSTAADVLEKLQGKHEIIEHILLYRQLGKLQSTYIEGLLKEIQEDGKIHTHYQQALTQTGRLSSIHPNLQNIPIRLEEGRKIRKAFVPSQEGWKMFAADYSQIELRVLADMSNDESLRSAFLNDQDIHTKTAMDVFHVAEQDVTANMRRAAKAVNFGIVYGISDYGLSQNLNITRKEAADFIERYFESFPGVKTYMDEKIEEAKEHGYVTTIMNRRRYISDIHSSNFNLRGFAERTAMNTPIQGSAADIIKKAMIDMDAALKKEKLEAKMLLQVHDELIFEAPEHEISKLEKLVPQVMEHAVKLSVPLKVDYNFGDTWYDTK